MNWKSIVVGVDGSPESVRAAVAGAMIAQRTGSPCHLVHAVAVADYLASLPQQFVVDVDAITESAMIGARAGIAASLRERVPAALIERLEVELGRAAVVLDDAARRHDAGLLVMGAKRRRGLERLGGSSLTHALRMGDVPLLATDGSAPTITRVLAAVDLSYAAQPTLETAQRWADLFGADLRVLHVVEPVPLVPGVNITVGDEEFYRSETRLLELNIWPLLTRAGAEPVVRRGRAAGVIADEVKTWSADLLVVGSHGKGWAHRLLIGSTTERLLHALPTMTLVVPVARSIGLRGLGVEALPWEHATPPVVEAELAAREMAARR